MWKKPSPSAGAFSWSLAICAEGIMRSQQPAATRMDADVHG
uniref:Uncharacterized protein n=1 Tax=Magnetospirillum gryphiswaldense TaxID=55518 RepID=A4U4Y2_9PROT|nr:hypothetical protein MGR_4007 [Magnetospirillum gryphiswaldense MSR-1]